MGPTQCVTMTGRCRNEAARTHGEWDATWPGTIWFRM